MICCKFGASAKNAARSSFTHLQEEMKSRHGTRVKHTAAHADRSSGYLYPPLLRVGKQTGKKAPICSSRLSGTRQRTAISGTHQRTPGPTDGLEKRTQMQARFLLHLCGMDFFSKSWRAQACGFCSRDLLFGCVFRAPVFERAKAY